MGGCVSKNLGFARRSPFRLVHGVRVRGAAAPGPPEPTAAGQQSEPVEGEVQAVARLLRRGLRRPSSTSFGSARLSCSLAVSARIFTRCVEKLMEESSWRCFAAARKMERGDGASSGGWAVAQALVSASQARASVSLMRLSRRCRASGCGRPVRESGRYGGPGRRTERCRSGATDPAGCTCEGSRQIFHRAVEAEAAARHCRPADASSQSRAVRPL